MKSPCVLADETAPDLLLLQLAPNIYVGRAGAWSLIRETISHYRILRKLGSGGMGLVYEAVDTRLGRRVALKFLPEQLCSEPHALERFEREARATSLLNHPNICTIYDIENYEGRPFIAMELMEGETLKQLLDSRTTADANVREPLELDQFLAIAMQVCDALEAAHAQGIVHRDLKPANIFMTRRGQAKVLDFGLAKLAPSLLRSPVLSGSGEETSAGPLDNRIDPRPAVPARAQPAPASASGFSAVMSGAGGEHSSLTVLGSIPGTVSYMSPEQVRNEELDARSDLFSFGVVLYEMATGRKPFVGNSVVSTMAAILEQKPISPRKLNPALPPEMEAILGKALEKPVRLRYQNAAELYADLRRLKEETEVLLPGKAITPARSRVFRRVTSLTRFWQWGLAGLLLTVALVSGLWWFKRARSAVPAARNAVAVLPFQNLSQNKDDDFLRVALADEITTILTYTHSLEVRPISTTAKYTEGASDPVKAGRELHVAVVVTGHFLSEGSNLAVTLEAIDVVHERLLWQSSISVAAKNSLLLQKELAEKVHRGLVPVIAGTASGTLETATRPRNADAYDLYLRSTAIPHDPAPNREGIAMLERSVGLDPGYAPAWDALGLRYYYESSYGRGGASMFERASHAYERAVSLDPRFLPAAAHLARNRVERGELAGGYQEARALVARRPNNAQAHFTFSYALRYAGRLQEAGKECEAALTLDPGDYGLRSCSLVFAEQGQIPRALDYLKLDSGSEWTKNVLPWVLLRGGDIAEARKAANEMTRDSIWFGGILQSCLAPGAPTDMAQLDAVVQDATPELLRQRDPEFNYLQGSVLAFCGEREAAVSLLRKAIGRNYCAGEALAEDPLLQKLRLYPQFEQLRAASQECLKRFLAASGQHE